MDGDGLVKFRGDPHLREEGRLLHVRVGVVEVVVVEANLTDGDAAWVRGELFEAGKGFGCGLVRLLRVDADRGEEAQGGPCVLVGERKRAVHGGGPIADTDGQQRMDAGRLRFLQDGGEVGIVVEVAVGVDQHNSLAYAVSHAVPIRGSDVPPGTTVE